MKPKPDEPLTADDLKPGRMVSAVFHGQGLWKTADRILAEDAAERRARKLREKYEFNVIPEPVFEDSDL